MRVGFCPVSVNNTNKVQPITNKPLTAKVEKMILHASVSACRFCLLRGFWSMPMVSTAKTQNRGAPFRAAPRFHAPSPLVSPSASRRPALPRLAPCRVANGCLERTIECKRSMRSVPTGRSAASNARRPIPRQRFYGGTVAAPLRRSGIGVCRICPAAGYLEAGYRGRCPARSTVPLAVSLQLAEHPCGHGLACQKGERR